MNKTVKFLSLSIFLFIIFLFFINFALAADPITTEVAIPTAGGEGKTSFTDFGEYMRTIYSFVIGAIGILAVVVVMWSGFLWMTARGNAEQVGRAKGYMSGAILGLVLALGSYSILYIINPKLVNMQFPSSQLTIPKAATTTTSCTGTRLCCCATNGQSTQVNCDKTCDGSILNCTDTIMCNEGATQCVSQTFMGATSYVCK